MHQAPRCYSMRKYQAGFGLLEVVISAGILATVIGASVGLMNSSLHRASLAADRATAMNLAQEAVELVRAARDTTYRDGLSNDWTAPFAQISTTVGTIATAGDSVALVYTTGTDGSCCYWQTAKTAPSGSTSSSTVNSGVETISLGGQSYQREVYISLPGIEYPKVACIEYPDNPAVICGPTTLTESDVIRKVTVIVRWGSSITQAVSSIVYLTNLRSS